MKNPPDYTHDLGEFIRAHRLYLGLSQRGMAKNLGDMDRRSYQRIENGQDPCPPGLLDTISELVAKFESEVDAVIEAATAELDREYGDNMDVRLKVRAPSDPRREWERAVVGRAAVDSTCVVPVLYDEVPWPT